MAVRRYGKRSVLRPQFYRGGAKIQCVDDRSLPTWKIFKKRIFTTHEASWSQESPLSAVTQALTHLEREGVINKICRGVWAREEAWSARSLHSHAVSIPRDRAYVSFISALHLHGIVEQIPQVITLASTAHAATIKTKVGVFQIHRIAPSFFAGFGWYKENGSFLIAEPEKALVDCLYFRRIRRNSLHISQSWIFPGRSVLRE